MARKEPISSLSTTSLVGLDLMPVVPPLIFRLRFVRVKGYIGRLLEKRQVAGVGDELDVS